MCKGGRLGARRRRLEGRFDDEAEMLAALSQAPWVTLAFELTPREGGRAGGL